MHIPICFRQGLYMCLSAIKNEHDSLRYEDGLHNNSAFSDRSVSIVVVEPAPVTEGPFFNSLASCQHIQYSV